MSNQKLNSISLAEDLTIRKVIGRVGIAGCDFNFAAAADHTQQNLDLGALIPAKSKVLDIQVVCVGAVVGVTDFTVVVGNAAAGAQFVAGAPARPGLDADLYCP